MGRILIVATAGAGGDLQPLVAVSLALRDRGHHIAFVGDGGVEGVLRPLAISTQVLPPSLDLGPRLAAAVREAMVASAGQPSGGGGIVVDRLAEWAADVAAPVRQAVAAYRPDLIVTSLFGVEVLSLVAPACPWVVVNSTYYLGPDPPRPIELDVAPRAVPILGRYAGLLDAPDLVLHATDRIFDLSFDGLPPRHRYVGALGIWEPPSEPPSWLAEPGPPWVLVSISSQVQDDAPLAQAAIEALADMPVRVVATLGPHRADELAAIPPNVRVASVSHAAVLRRAAFAVGHAGHGSVMKALRLGCPVVLVPWARDQPGVAVRAERLGVASVVHRDDLSVEALRRACESVVSDDAFRARARDHSARLSRMNPPVDAAEAIAALI